MSDSKKVTTKELFMNAITDNAGIKYTDEQTILPSDNDFMAESFSIDLYNSLNENHIKDSFYLEAPCYTEPGYYNDEDIFIIKAIPYISDTIEHFYNGADKEKLKRTATEKDINNEFDGDTLYFINKTINSGMSTFKIGDRTYSSFEEFLNISTNQSGKFGVRFLGLNTPEIPHYASVPMEKDKQDKYIYKIKEVRGLSKYTYREYNNDGTKRSDDQELYFYHDEENDHYYEISSFSLAESLNTLSNEEKNTLKNNNADMWQIVYSCEQDKNIEYGLKEKELVKEMLGKAEDIVLMLDRKSLNKKSNSWINPYNNDYFESVYNDGGIWKSISNKWNKFFSAQRYRYPGYNAWGQDNNRRFLGAVYVKVDNNWYNLNKYIIANYPDKLDILPDYTGDPRQQMSNGFVSNAFKLWTYDYVNKEILDAFTKFQDTEKNAIKNRNEVIQKVTGMPVDTLIENTVIIGDCCFVIPPTSIRTLTRNQTEKVQLLRSKGVAAKTAPQSEKIIELHLYFNNEANINGTPYEITYPNLKTKETYYMNGLRALIAQFKLTPFLPIDNKYINEILNVYAVTLVNLQVKTMVGFPKCLDVTLTLQEFNYRIFMPELPLPEDMSAENVFSKNAFASIINYPVMRYYYQRLLQRGEKIKNLDVTSQQYISATYGETTALIPMTFDDPTIEFYLPDKEWLDKRLKVAMEKEASSLYQTYKTTDNMKKVLSEMAQCYKPVNNILSNADFTSISNELKQNKVIDIGYDDYFYNFDTNKFEQTNTVIIPFSINAFCVGNDVSLSTSVYSSFDSIMDFSCLRMTQSVDWDNQTPANIYALEQISANNFEAAGCSIISGSKRNSSEILKDLSDVFNIDIPMPMKKEITQTINKENLNNNKASVDINLLINLPEYIPNEYELTVFKKKIATLLEVSEEDLFTVGQGGELSITIPIHINFDLIPIPTGDNNVNGTYYASKFNNITCDKNSPGMKFLQYCYNSTKKVEDAEGNVRFLDFVGNIDENMYDDTMQLDKANKEESANSIKFVKYEMGEDIIIESCSCVFENAITRLSLNGLDGYAHQYCGGQNAVIEFRIVTKNDNVARLLVNLPRLASQYVKDYKKILANWPLRIKSEITRFLGVNEVLIDTVDLSTVPNYPGLHAITVRMTALDRATRNRETLKKIEDINNAGSTADQGNTTYNLKTYFQLKQVLGKAEIYPDLELPTIDELNFLGWQTTLFNSAIEPNRKYVDPDFYFMYAYQLNHEILRSGLMKSFSDHDVKTDFLISDKFGAVQKLSEVVNDDNNKDAVIKKPYLSEEINDTAKLEEEEMHKAANKNTTIDYKQIQEDIYDALDEKELVTAKLSSTLCDLGTPIWNVSDQYNFPLREKKYEAIADYEGEDIYVSTIKDLKNQSLEIINNELTKSISLKSLGIDTITDLKSIAKECNTAKSETEWAEKRIKDFLEKMFTTLEVVDHFGAVLANRPGENYNAGFDIKTIKGLFYAYADAVTGYTNCNQVQFDPISGIFLKTEDDKKSDINWRMRPFINYGKNVYDGIEEPIPFCKIRNNQDSEMIKADSLKQGIEKGYMFGVFQIPMIKKEYIYDFVDTDEEKELIKKHEDILFFMDDYYRNLQLQNTEEAKQELDEYKKLCLIDPAFCAYAFYRNLMVWYKRLVKEDIAISMYEVFKTEAAKIYKDEVTVHTNAVLEETSQDKLDKLSKDAINKAQKELNYYIEAYVAIYCDLFTSSDDFTAEGFDENGVPENLIEHIEKRKEKGYNNKNILIDKYTEIKSNYDNQISDEDFSREAVENLLKILETDTQEGVISVGTDISALKTKIETEISINTQCLDAILEQLMSATLNAVIGKFIALSLLELCNGYNIYDLLKNKKTAELNSLINSIISNVELSSYTKYNKYLCALDGRNIIKLELMGKDKLTAESFIKTAAAERVYIRRSNNIAAYLKDSFIDMIYNDKRGRMLRAFPTFYMLFIDEGRKIGLWKLHDNFYNMNAISSITVTKSRKIAADTAEILMSNMFKTFSNDDPIYDYDISEINNMRYTMRDAFCSIFSPRTYYLKEEINRTMQETPRSTQLNPGVRIHIREGYGANAATLPIVFNGVIAEIGTGDVMQIVAQGDGVELLNPITQLDDAADIQNQEKFFIEKYLSNWMTNGATPKQILTAILTQRGSWLQNQIRTVTNGRFFNDNPYGIVHFGDQYFTDIFSGGEVIQNIYEANPRSTYGKGGAYTGLEEFYDTGDTPIISIHCFGKSFWDILNICASVQPDFIASIVPFGLRSSIYFGNNRSYYAYDYYQQDNMDGSKCILEKRKPFQQHHIFTSFTDIIHNNIKATGQNIKTNAIGLYQSKKLFGEETEQVGPLYVDYDIYPEFQKSMTVDTQLWAKGMFILGNVFGFNENISKDVNATIPGGKEIAWRMTATALKNKMKDMYDGEITVIGYPSIKPYDRMWINDIYEQMTGQSEVEAVVHSFNVETGFTTSIYADCISMVDDMYEQFATMRVSKAVGAALTTMFANAVNYIAFEQSGKAIIGSLSKTLAKGISLSSKAIINIRKMLDKESGDLLTKLAAKNVDIIPESTVLSVGASTGLALASMAIEMAVVYVLSANCSEFIYRYLQNLEVLQIMPMKKKGRVMVSGINGHKGCVIGSPTEGQQGDWTSFCISMFDGKSAGAAESLINYIFGNNYITHIANKLRRDNDLPEIDLDKNIDREKLMNDITQDVSTIYIRQSEKNRRNIMSVERISDMGKNSINYIIYYKLNYDKDLTRCYDIVDHTIPITSIEELKEYFDRGFLKIFNLKTGQENKRITLNFNGTISEIDYFETENGSYDIATIRLETAFLLVDCITKIAKKFNIQNLSVGTTFNPPKVYITSASVIGESEITWENTGYAFRLQVGDWDETQMQAFVDELVEDYKKEGNENYFTYTKIKDSKEYCFVVKPTINKSIEDGMGF